MVSGPWDLARETVLDSLAPGRLSAARALSSAETDELRQSLSSDLILLLIGAAELQDRAFLAALEEVFESAASGTLSDQEYRELLQLVGNRFGAAATAEGAVLAEAWLDSAILTPAFRRGELLAQQHPVVEPLHPYIRYNTRQDDRVRDNHDALDGFVARASWGGWVLEVLPPHGWRCRCRPEYISWQIAQQLGWTGDFPLGTAALERFRALGGSDPGFPRSTFVQPALALGQAA